MRSLVRSWAAYALLPVVGIATSPLLARALGPDGRGELAAVLQPLTIASAIAVLGVPSAVTYFLARGSLRASVLRRARVLAAASTVCVAIVLVFYSSAVAENLSFSRTVVLSIWLAFLPSAFISIRRSELQSSGDYLPIDRERAGGAIFRLTAIVLLFLAGVTIPVPYAICYMGAGLLAATFLVRRGERAVTSSETGSAISRSTFFTYAATASFGTIAVAMNSRLDQAIMPATSSSHELGYYSAAVAVAEAPMVITIVVCRNLMTEASRGQKFHRTLLLGAAALGAICVVGVVSASWAVPFAFGSDFSPAVLPTQILLVATFVQFFSDTRISVLTGSGRPGLGSIGPVAAILVTVIAFAMLWGDVSAVNASLVAVVAQMSSAVVGTGVGFMKGDHRARSSERLASGK